MAKFLLIALSLTHQSSCTAYLQRSGVNSCRTSSILILATSALFALGTAWKRLVFGTKVELGTMLLLLGLSELFERVYRLHDGIYEILFDAKRLFLKWPRHAEVLRMQHRAHYSLIVARLQSMSEVSVDRLQPLRSLVISRPPSNQQCYKSQLSLSSCVCNMLSL